MLAAMAKGSKMIIGLMGAAGSGKSTAALYMHEAYDARIYSFAKPLKEIVRLTFDFTSKQVYGSQAEKEAIDSRYSFSPRWIMQRLGTEGVRKVLGQDFWCSHTINEIRLEQERKPDMLAVIDDVRFPDEAQAILDTGGLVWRLECPDRMSSEDSSHASESGWLSAPYSRIISAPLSPLSVLLLEKIDFAMEDEFNHALATES